MFGPGLDLTALLDAAGFRIEGPCPSDEDGLRGKFWWTLYRDGWSGVECGQALATAAEARADAAMALMADEDLDWASCEIAVYAINGFPPNFPSLMREAASSGVRSLIQGYAFRDGL